MKKITILALVIVLVSIFIVFSATQFTGKVALGQCTDTDNGVNYNLTGTAKNENRDDTYTDACINNRKLREYYCYTDFQIKSTKYTCQDYCVEGACTG